MMHILQIEPKGGFTSHTWAERGSSTIHNSDEEEEEEDQSKTFTSTVDVDAIKV